LRKTNGQTLSELCEHLENDAAGGDEAFGVAGKSKPHRRRVVRARRSCIISIRLPLHEIYERWIGKYERHRLQALSDLKKGSRTKQGPGKTKTM